MSKNDDPFAPSDATILRPKPGAGRRPGAAPAGSPAAAQQPPAGAPPSYSSSPSSGMDAPRASHAAGASIGEFMSTGINPLVQAATALLVLAGKLRGQISNADIDSLRRQATQEIRSFEDNARQAGIPPEDVLAARYVICSTIDEAVLNTPWGAQSGWAAQSLLVTFHRESFGGEKFFQILDRISGEPQRYQYLLELLYVCLSLGFEGKYRVDDRGANKLADIRQNLYRRIHGLRGAAEPELSPRWKGIEDKRNAVIRFVPLWVVAAACGAILIGAFIFFNARLGVQATPVNDALAKAGTEAPPAPVAVALPPTGLPQLLRDEISRRLVSVEEEPGLVRITLISTDLFASGSDRLNASYGPLVHRIGSALEQLPGRILVVGHTDDQPIRSFRFTDNYDLSRQRAQRVTELMKQDVTNAARIDFTGVGPGEPRYLPADLPQNRARNRRVEIIFRPEAAPGA